MATRTARYCIESAFRWIGMISEDEGVTAEQANRGLTVMNDMMNGWPAEGIEYGHTDLVLIDTVNVPDDLVQSTWRMLADAIADEYGKVLTDRQQKRVEEARSNLQGYYFRVPPAQIDDGLQPRWPVGYWDVRRG